MSRYQARDIEVLSGLDPVRKRPGMYTDTRAPDHLAQEVIDNSVDEALAGTAKRLRVTLHDDGALEVEDDGRGMPVDPHPKLQRPGVEVILSTLHAGAKFSGDQYRRAGGLHGVGVSVVCALSARLDVWIKRDRKEFQIGFEGGRLVDELRAVGAVGARNTGTRLRFAPDAQYFERPDFDARRLAELLRAKAVLCPGLDVQLRTPDGKEQRWRYADGLEQYLREALAGAETLPAEPLRGRSDDGPRSADWTYCWTPDAEPALAESYVNLIPTPDGGTHVGMLRAGLTQAARGFAEGRGVLPRGVKLAPEDVWSGLNYVLSYRTERPQFTGQTKQKFTGREDDSALSAQVAGDFAAWLASHVAQGERLAQLWLAAASRRAQAKKVSRKKAASGPTLPGKLADCARGRREGSELFLVEGDSAGGSARQARDRSFQAVLPLRGKILNTWDASAQTALGSQEVRDIAQALGVAPGDADLEALRYERVCILADADSDGLHIATLLCALFLRHFPALVRAGHLHVAMPPLYRIDIGREVHYALDDAERDRILAARRGNGAQPVVLRFKGLGEMDPAQLREAAMAPKTRRLVQLQEESPKRAQALLDRLLGRGNAAARRAWLEKSGHLAEW